MCVKALGKNRWVLGDVPDWFITSEMCDRFTGTYRIKECKSRKRLKTAIDHELLPIIMHPDWVFDWCFDEDEKKDLEKYGTNFFLKS